MNYIFIGCVCLIILHFCLYYLNVDVFNLSNNVINNEIKNNVQLKPIIESNIEEIDNTIEDSINQLKKLNEYIDNGSSQIASS